MERELVAHLLTSEAVSVVFGTILGAAISWVASMHVYSVQRKDQVLTSAHSILIQVQVCFSNLVAISNHIRDSISEFEKSVSSNSDQTWAKVIPLTSVPEQWQLKSSDMMFFARAKEYQLMQDVITLSMRYSALVGAMSLYSQLRTELVRELRPSQNEGNILGSLLADDEIQKILPRSLELNTLINSIIGMLKEDVGFARDVLNRISPAAKNYFGEGEFPNVRTNS